MKSIRLKKKKLIYSATAGAAGMFILCSIGGYFLYQKAEENELALKKQYKAEIAELEKITLQSRIGYALNRAVEKGDKITEDLMTPVYLPDAAASSDLLSAIVYDANYQPYYAKTDLAEATVLTESMLYEETMITSDMREGEYAFIELPSKLEVDQYVDIRVQFPTGDDYVVLAKKKVKDVQGITVWLDVDEGEILTVSSGIVDAYIEGAKFYAMPYVDEHMQAPSVMTYPVKANVRELIENSPNIVNRAKLHLELQNRARLENNLLDLSESERMSVQAGATNTTNSQKVDQSRLSAEEKVNELNEQSLNQQDLVGGSGE